MVLSFNISETDERFFFVNLVKVVLNANVAMGLHRVMLLEPDTFEPSDQIDVFLQPDPNDPTAALANVFFASDPFPFNTEGAINVLETGDLQYLSPFPR